MNSAVEYFLAGERCNQPLAFGQYPKHELGTPVAVHYAFSIELVLKVLLKKSEITYAHLRGIDGHSLRQLFDLLPDDSKIHLQWLSPQFEDFQKSENDDNACQNIIDEIDRVFVNWRYHFESAFLSTSVTNLNRAFVIIHTEIRRKFPDFMSDREREWGQFDLELLGPHTALKIISKENLGSSYE
jgi:hypothetical protein